MGYFIPISMGHLTAVIPADGVIWAFRNTHGSYGVKIRRLSVTIGFDGTASPDSSKFGIYRFIGANFSGGASIVPAKRYTGQSISIVTDARQSGASALVQAGVIIEPTPFISVQNQRDKSATTAEVHEWSPKDSILLSPGEGLCIKLDSASVIGDYISGTCGYDEVRYNIYS